MSTNKQKSGISFFNANFTTIISVSLVLLLLGLVAMLAMAGANLTTQIKENIGFDVVVKENADAKEVNQLKQLWNRADYVSNVKFISKEDALRSWEQETGEDLMATLGVNPLSAEFEVRVKSQYASSDSLNKISKQLSNNPAIERIQIQRDLVDSINRNVSNVAIILGAIAIVLMIISFALINNTVRLSVYSKRFLIHTMKLVGAKSGFIRRPFIISNIINGIIAGIIAEALLSLSIYYAIQVSDEVQDLLSMSEIYCVFGAVMLLGMALCALAAYLASTKFIRLDYDSLFKQ
ncbi:MAG: permease-like cell division protein FtsX [Muribaculaceae bacterium]|nr:permease-like cell division protein FtsX [Muribaculaceae bacterium]